MQNIAEGSKASGTSKKMEIKLTNVARASLEELRLDYEDFLRQRKLMMWEKKDPRRQSLIDSRPKTADDVARWVRDAARSGLGGLGGQSGQSGQSGQKKVSTASTKSTKSTASPQSLYPEYSANAALVLIAVACSLLDRQIAAQAKAFETEGGFTERLHRVRSKRRNDS